MARSFKTKDTRRIINTHTKLVLYIYIGKLINFLGNDYKYRYNKPVKAQ